MDYDFTPFLTFWRTHELVFINDLYTDLIGALPSYTRLPREQLVASIARKNRLWQQLLLTGDHTPILERTRALVQQRTGDQFPLIEMIKTGDLYRDHLWRLLHHFYASAPLSLTAIDQIEHWTRVDRDVILSAYSDELQRTHLALSEQIALLEQQASLIHDLSTPLIPIAAHIVALPLVGTIDAARLQQVLEALLEGIVNYRAHVAIIDLTGVALVDTFVAQGLVRAAHASTLLGAQIIVTGIRPEVAQTLVGLGVSLGGIITRATLQDAIAYALRAQR